MCIRDSLSLLCAYHPVDEGNIYLSGIALDHVANLNDLVTIMRQDSIFFDGSLADNLSMYHPVSDEKLMDGLRRLGPVSYTHLDVYKRQVRT